MGDGILDKFPIIQDQTSPNLAHIPTTNLIPYSEKISQFTTVALTVLDNNIISPQGIINASKITETTGGSIHYVGFGINGVSSNYAWSCFLKQGTVRYAGIRAVVNGFANRFFVNVDLLNGSVADTNTVGSGVTWEYSVEKFDNWYRLIITAPNTSGNIDLSISPSDQANPSYSLGFPSFSGNSNNYFYTWGAQLEQQSQATEYLPSYGVASVRKATTTNLIPYSEDFSQANQLQNVTLTSNAIASPIGTNNGTKVLSTASNSKVSVTGLSFVAGTTYTVSVFCKNIDATSLNLFVRRS
jgi:hypothetical protein